MKTFFNCSSDKSRPSFVGGPGITETPDHPRILRRCISLSARMGRAPKVVGPHRNLHGSALRAVCSRSAYADLPPWSVGYPTKSRHVSVGPFGSQAPASLADRCHLWPGLDFRPRWMSN